MRVVFLLLLSPLLALAAVSDGELTALTDMFLATQPWETVSRWLEGDPCDNQWFGVQCGGPVNPYQVT